MALSLVGVPGASATRRALFLSLIHPILTLLGYGTAMHPVTHHVLSYATFSFLPCALLGIFSFDCGPLKKLCVREISSVKYL